MRKDVHYTTNLFFRIVFVGSEKVDNEEVRVCMPYIRFSNDDTHFADGQKEQPFSVGMFAKAETLVQRFAFLSKRQ